MIIGSFSPHIIGKRYTGIVDLDYKYHPNQPVVVLEQVTYEDWVRYIEEEMGRSIPQFQKESAKSGFFYRISVD